MGALMRSQRQRDVIQLKMAAAIGQRVALHRLDKDFAGFRIVTWRRLRSNPEVTQFDWERAAPYTQFDPATTQLVQHANLLERTQRMIKGKEHYQGADAKVPGALDDTG
ncbi:hypothetical protein MESS2_980078 [Mesorhizobium metallidurans STM 2683]|uniref:Uncharacterized protein n=1 Tax=Mesorhizobium metallidurans STM 2683 TaxID=1297569 RepID=M5EZM7_9HYPH|nr:hypothetical protein MESS2_980078 [Mesorhizobium metallidurans STM 2683]